MSWLRIDDGFASHPKLAGLTDLQHRIWIRTLCYCAKYNSPELTDERLGEIPGFDGGVTGRLMRVFLGARLVDCLDGHYLVHDWDEYQPKDSTGAERQRRYRAKRNVTRNEAVTSLSRTPSRPVPRKSVNTLSGEEPNLAPTEAEIVAAREIRENSGWVDNLSQYTGCRYTRGEHSIHAVYDPLGTEFPPTDWPYQRPTKQEVVAALRSNSA